jgi:hypothetical protein
MDVTVVTPHPFWMAARVPDDMVSLDPDGEWAAWSGFDCATDGERKSVVLVAIAVTAFPTAPGAAPAEELAALLRARHPAGTAVLEELAAADGNPALQIRRTVTEQRGGRPVTTGQAQAFVLFPGAGALGVVSAVCLDAADLDRASGLVAGIAARMTVTAAPAAA